jgi:hypothetical protein
MALKLLNELIPGFEQKADAADNLSSYCSPVSLTNVLHQPTWVFANLTLA